MFCILALDVTERAMFLTFCVSTSSANHSPDKLKTQKTLERRSKKNTGTNLAL